jgi:hypothetical protein
MLYLRVEKSPGIAPLLRHSPNTIRIVFGQYCVVIIPIGYSNEPSQISLCRTEPFAH